MFDPQLNNPELFLNKDFIGVWDNVVKNDFNKLVIKWIDESTQICPRSNIGVKDSQVDIAAFNPQMSNHIMQAVRLCLLEYIDWYPFLKNYNYHSTTCVLQKTIPTEGYHNFHIEKGPEPDQIYRTVVYTVYLNDVEEGGETEFLFQLKKYLLKKELYVYFLLIILTHIGEILPIQIQNI